MFCFKLVFPGWLFSSSQLELTQHLQKYIKILLFFYSIEPSYNTSQMFCFEDTLLQNKTFKKKALYEGSTEWVLHKTQ